MTYRAAPCLGLFFILILGAPGAWCESAPAAPAPEDPPAASEEELTRRLSELVRRSEDQAESGDRAAALGTLAQAQHLAQAARRPEARQIEARMLRLREAPESPAQHADPGKATEDKKGGERPAPPNLLLKLEECIEIAIQNNLGLKLNRIDDRLSDLGLRIAYSRYLPDFDVGLNHRGGANGTDNHSNTTTLSGSVTQRSPWGTSATLSGSESIDHPGSDGAIRSSYGVSVSQPLWKGAGLDVGLRDIRASKLSKLIARGSLELNVQDLIFTIKRNYANCVKQIQQYEVNRKAVESAETFLKLTKANEQAGRVTKLDVFESEVQLADRELALTAKKRGLLSAYDDLKRNMDVDLEENIEVESPLVDFGEKTQRTKEDEKERKFIEIVEAEGKVVLATYEVKWVEERREERVPEGGVEKVVVFTTKRSELGQRIGDPVLMFQAVHFDERAVLEEALANRIEILNSRRNLATQKLDALLSKDGLGHQVDLTASYGRSGSGSNGTESHGYEDHDYAVGINLSIPWGKVSDRAAYERAILDIQRAEIDLKGTRTLVHQDVRSILRQLREAEQSILIQGKKVEQAKRLVEAAQISFERGLKDSADVIRSEDKLLAAKTDFISLTIDYVIQLANVETIVGKPTGRVDLSAKSPGGFVDSILPESLQGRPLPRAAPHAEPKPEDDPFQYERKKD